MQRSKKYFRRFCVIGLLGLSELCAQSPRRQEHPRSHPPEGFRKANPVQHSDKRQVDKDRIGSVPGRYFQKYLDDASRGGLTSGAMPEHGQPHPSSRPANVEGSGEEYIAALPQIQNSPKLAWSANYASGLVPPSDGGVITADTAGNFYAISSCDGDYRTTKYNPSGSEQWVARYKGGGRQSDHAVAIATDDDGNVFVTGYSSGRGSAYDYATVKYNSSGVEQWRARYDGPGNGDDYAVAIALDPAGNSFVTGYSLGADSSFGYATIKYDASGIQEWVSRYEGILPGDDCAAAICIGVSGDLWVTGTTPGSGIYNHSDIATIKYNRSGVQQWVSLYDNPGHTTDAVKVMTVDDSNNVFIAGWIDGLITASGHDIVAVKYDPSGMKKWAAVYNGPSNYTDEVSAIILDGAGNLFVAGSSWGTYLDYVAIKYDRNGATRWVARYDGEGDRDDRPAAVALDSSGNFYVTGLSFSQFYDEGVMELNSDYATVKYDSAGVEQWAAKYHGPDDRDDQATGLRISGSGEMMVLGTCADDRELISYTIVKYDLSGAEESVVACYSPGSSDDQAVAVVRDRYGNLYVTGYGVSDYPYDDFVTVKYNPAGVQEWVSRFDGPGNGDDHATAMALDDSGNVYVTGVAWGADTSFDYATIKYNPSGVLEWASLYDGPGNSDDYPADIALDPSGNAFVTGSSVGAGTGEDYATVKYNGSGGVEWAVRHNGSGNGYDEAAALEVDSSGNVFVTGVTLSILPQASLGCLTVKYDPSGIQQWVAEYHGPSWNVDRPSAIALDAAGNIYVTGRSHDDLTSNDYVTLKYLPTGLQAWAARYNGAGNGSDEGVSVVAGLSGGVYVTGRSEGPDGSIDYATVKYGPDGIQQWVKGYDGPGRSVDWVAAMALDDSGGVYVTGSSHDLDSTYDYVTIKYDSSGEQEWMARYDGTDHGDDYATSIAIDDTGNVYVAGSTQFSVGRQYTTIKYEQLPMYKYNQRWNMVSLPRRVLNPSRVDVFPSAISPLYEYSGAYVHRESLEVGKGYWIKFQAADSIYLRGEDLLFDSVDVVTGWNMIGSITYPVKFSEITSFPVPITTSNLYGYDGSYFLSDSILPGKGYWVKCDQAGKLILSVTNDLLLQNRIKIVQSDEPPPASPEDIGVPKKNTPQTFSLEQNYPNPFNPVTSIKYHIPAGSYVTLKVFNLLGQEVSCLVDGIQPAGNYEVSFDASRHPSGVYYYRLTSADEADGRITGKKIMKALLLK